MAQNFSLERDGSTAHVTLTNRIDGTTAPALAEALTALIGTEVTRIVFLAHGLTYVSSMGLRAIIFIKQKLGKDSKVYLVGAPPSVVEVFTVTGFDRFVLIQDSAPE